MLGAPGDAGGHLSQPLLLQQSHSGGVRGPPAQSAQSAQGPSGRWVTCSEGVRGAQRGKGSSRVRSVGRGSGAGEGGGTGWRGRGRTLSSLSLQGRGAAERGTRRAEPSTASPLPAASGQARTLRPSPHPAPARHPRTCPCTRAEQRPPGAHSEHPRSALCSLAPALTAQRPGCVGPAPQLPPQHRSNPGPPLRCCRLRPQPPRLWGKSGTKDSPAQPPGPAPASIFCASCTGPGGRRTGRGHALTLHLGLPVLPGVEVQQLLAGALPLLPLQHPQAGRLRPGQHGPPTSAGHLHPALVVGDPFLLLGLSFLLRGT